jgi:hypothetical protein
MTPDQAKSLKSRKGVTLKTEEERWKEIYRILFPLEPEASIPSPCKISPLDIYAECRLAQSDYDDLITANGANNEDLQRWLKRKLPAAVNKVLTETLQRESLPSAVQGRIEAAVDSAVRAGIEKLSQDFLTTQGPLAEPHIPQEPLYFPLGSNFGSGSTDATSSSLDLYSCLNDNYITCSYPMVPVWSDDAQGSQFPEPEPGLEPFPDPFQVFEDPFEPFPDHHFQVVGEPGLQPFPNYSRVFEEERKWDIHPEFQDVSPAHLSR